MRGFSLHFKKDSYGSELALHGHPSPQAIILPPFLVPTSISETPERESPHRLILSVGFDLEQPHGIAAENLFSLCL
jgi:hypothetical protein